MNLNLNYRTLALVALAIVSAGMTFFLAKTWIDSQRDKLISEAEKNKPEMTESVNILIAKQNLPSGLIMQPGHVEWQAWPEDGVAKSYILEGRDMLADVLGAVVRGGIIVGEPITAGRVIKRGARGFMAAVLRPGMRAVSVRMKPDTSVSGFIKPGDRIDLLVTHSVVPAQSANPIRHTVVETILSDLKVIAIDQSSDDQGTAPLIFGTVTFEVTSKQAEIVTVAKRIGQLSMILRSLADPNVKANQAARRKNRRTTTWDSHASRVLPPVSGNSGQLEVVRGKTQEAAAIGGLGGGLGQGVQGLNTGLAAGASAASGVARTLAR